MALVKNGLAALPGKQSFKLAVVCLRLCSFSPSVGYFLQFFSAMSFAEFRCEDTWCGTKKTNINNGHFLKSSAQGNRLLLSIFRKWFECDAAFSVVVPCALLPAALPVRWVGTWTQLNFYFVVFIYYLMDRLLWPPKFYETVPSNINHLTNCSYATNVSWPKIFYT